MKHAVGPEPPAALCIKVIGVGGAGSNAVDRMIQAGLGGVEFIAANTDAQALVRSEAARRIQLGPRAAKGLGVGGDPQWGARTAEESKDAIREALRGADAVFIAAGMGGGTGTGAAPVVARIAREEGALTVAAVTRPFSFEGTRRRNIADQGVRILSKHVHSLIVVSNDRLLPVVGRDMTFDVALRVADDVLRQGIQGISELITRPGLVNLDFASIRTALQGAGGALMAIGRGWGEQKAVQAAQSALNSPLLNCELISSAETILVNITGGCDLTLHEVSDAAQLVCEASGPGADILFGAIIDSQMEGEAHVILVAGGIDAWGQEKQSALEPLPASARAHMLPVQVDAYTRGGQIESVAPMHRREGDQEQDAHLAEPVDSAAYWPVLVPAGDAARGEVGAASGSAPTRRQRLPSAPSSSPQELRPMQESLILSTPSSTVSTGLVTSPSDDDTRQDKGAQPGPETEGQEFDAESDENEYREKTMLRFLPSLDFPAFLRR